MLRNKTIIKNTHYGVESRFYYHYIEFIYGVPIVTAQPDIYIDR